jgi:hypothetical protein
MNLDESIQTACSEKGPRAMQTTVPSLTLEQFEQIMALLKEGSSQWKNVAGISICNSLI